MPGVTVKEVHPQFVLLSDGGVVKRVELPATAPQMRVDSPMGMIQPQAAPPVSAPNPASPPPPPPAQIPAGQEGGAQQSPSNLPPSMMGHARHVGDH